MWRPAPRRLLAPCLPAVRSHSLPSAAPFRRGYDRRPDLLFHSVRAGSSPRRRPRLSPPPPLLLTLYYWGKNFKGAAGVRQAAEKLSRGGVKTIQRRKNYPGRAEVPKNSKKNPKIVAQYRKYPIPYVYTLSRTIPYLYTWNRTIAYLYTLSRTIPYLNTLSRTIPYLNTLSRTIPYLNTLSRTIHYLNTLSRTIHYLNTLTRTIPYLNTLKKTQI